jgi:hypothetical protein
MLPRPRRLSRPPRLAASLALAGALGALFSAGAVHAQTSVSISPTVTTSGALYTYSYSITNFTDTDLAFVNLDNLPLVGGALTNLSAPSGFLSTFDPGVGIATFAPDNTANYGEFAPGSTISGFSFSSTFGPGTVAYDTLDLYGDPYTGTTVGPSAAVPEASTWVSVGAGLLALTFCAVRRRQAAHSDVTS